MIIAIIAISTLGAFAAIGISYWRFFAQNPLLASLRAFIAILALLAGNAALPTFDVAGTLTLDLGPVFVFESAPVQFTSGNDSTWLVAFVGMSALCAICLFRVPTPQPSR